MARQKKLLKFKLYFWKAHHRKTGKVVWRIDQNGKTYYADQVRLVCPVWTESRSKNPHAVLVGWGRIERVLGVGKKKVFVIYL